MSSFVNWTALGEVVVVGLLLGAGLPALFALGVRALAGPGSVTASGQRSRLRIALGVLCFAIVVSAVATAIWIIGSGGH